MRNHVGWLMGKRVCSHFAVVCLTIAVIWSTPMVALAGFAQSFSDKPAPSQDEIVSAVRWDLLQGYPDSTLRLQAPVTRGEFSAILCRALGLASNGRPHGFSDISQSDAEWWESSLGSLENSNVITPNAAFFAPGRRFDPNLSLTRAEAASWVESALISVNHVQPSNSVPASFVPFKDVDTNTPSSEAISLDAYVGIFKGFPGAVFRPEAVLTRGDAADVAVRLVESFEGGVDEGVFDQMYDSREESSFSPSAWNGVYGELAFEKWRDHKAASEGYRLNSIGHRIADVSSGTHIWGTVAITEYLLTDDWNNQSKYSPVAPVAYKYVIAPIFWRKIGDKWLITGGQIGMHWLPGNPVAGDSVN